MQMMMALHGMPNGPCVYTDDIYYSSTAAQRGVQLASLRRATTSVNCILQPVSFNLSYLC
jgi:hypothetical protein